MHEPNRIEEGTRTEPIPDAIDQARKLLSAEIDLAKDDLRAMAAAAAWSAAAFGAAALLTLVGAEALVLSVALAGRRDRPGRSAALGMGLLACAAGAALLGRASLPRSPRPIASRIAADVADVAERVSS